MGIEVRNYTNECAYYPLKNVITFYNMLLIQSLSHVWLFATPWTATYQASLSFTISQNLLKLVCLLSCDAIEPSHLLSPPSSVISLSQHQVIFQESALHIMWPKYWSFRFSISLSNEYSGLISFGIDWFDLFAVQGILNSLLQQLIHLLKYNIFSSDIHTFIQFIFFLIS